MSGFNRAAQAADFGGLGGQFAIPTHPLVTADILAGQHPQRSWEYSQALRALEHHIRWTAAWPEPVDAPRIIDIGGASSNFWHALATYTCQRVIRVDPRFLTDAEPVVGCFPNTVADYRWLTQGKDRFDAVFCLSVLEHVPPAEVVPFIGDLLALVAPGGLLVLTCDYADGVHAPYHFAPMREWMPEAATISPLLEVLGAQGFSALDAVDLQYYGPTVYNYGILSLALVKG